MLQARVVFVHDFVFGTIMDNHREDICPSPLSLPFQRGQRSPGWLLLLEEGDAETSCWSNCPDLCPEMTLAPETQNPWPGTVQALGAFPAAGEARVLSQTEHLLWTHPCLECRPETPDLFLLPPTLGLGFIIIHNTW